MELQLIGGIREVVLRYDGFILDLWGVIHDGVAPMPGAVECLRSLLENGKRIVLLSNAPRRADDVVRRITRIGVPADLYHHVMSSGEEAWQHLNRRDDPFYARLGRRCLHIGSERDMEIREGLALEFVDTAEEAQFILNTGPAGWDDRIEDYELLLRRTGPRFADDLRQPRSRRHARQPARALRRGIGEMVRGGRRSRALARQAVSLGLRHLPRPSRD